MKPVLLHPEAEIELEEAADFYEGRRTGYGELFRAEMDDALAQICNNPTVFSPYKGGPTRRRLLKRFPFGVYFVERAHAIYVVAVVNQRRRPDYWIDRLNEV
jgi:toxin ParE1/3/4